MTKPLFLDTTIQVDRILKAEPPALLVPLRSLLAQFDYFIACSYSRLEFKRVVIQGLGLILNYLCEEQSFFRALQRAQAVGGGRSRRASTLVSIMAWIGFRIDEQVEVILGEGIDRQMAIKAESYVRNAIRFLWKRFDKSVDSIQDGTQCKRAVEGPKPKADGSFEVSIPRSKCKTKECNNANFFQSNLPLLKRLRDELQRLSQEAGRTKFTEELDAALEHVTAAISNPSRLYDYENCIGVGDVWLHLECVAAGVKDFATTNYKESQVLCPMMGLTMRQP
ncbi:MAG TPA: hypothetical protein VJ739_03005 [Gemmataceae bacterium]|nr:hypothetical protein [Gemmataceae bacterium]